MKRRAFLMTLVLPLVATVTRTVRAEGQIKKEAPSVYEGNAQSHIFHKPGCRYYGCKACTARFEKREDAIKAGYRPCKVCRP
jgi:methylphosphotriester-DNA--protein-cysteine methyltransferase